MAIGYIDTEDSPTWLKRQWDKEVELEAKLDDRMYKAAREKHG